MARNGFGQYDIPVNSWYPPVSSTPATASDWQSTIEDIAEALTQSVSRDGQTPILQNMLMGGNKLTGLSAGTASGDSLRYEQLFSQGVQQRLASAATTDIGAQLTTSLNITGTTTITSFGVNYNGHRFLKFSGILTLTHNSTTLILPGGLNIVTAAGDYAIVIPNGSPATGWVVVAYCPASGVYSPSANGHLSGFRNLLINGNFSINQREYVSGTNVAAGTYTLDRWKTVAAAQSVLYSAFGNGFQITAPAGGVEQIIEGVNVAGGTYTINWSGTATLRVNGATVAKGATLSLPENTDVSVVFVAGTVALAQLEPGKTPTQFENRSVTQETQLCNRYYQIVVGGFTGAVTSGSVYAGYTQIPIIMRATPTVAYIGAFAINGFAGTAPTFANKSVYGFLFRKTSNDTVTDGFYIIKCSLSSEL